MARVNLNKSEELVTNITAASFKVGNSNLTSQHSHLEVLLLSFWSEIDSIDTAK